MADDLAAEVEGALKQAARAVYDEGRGVGLISIATSAASEARARVAEVVAARVADGSWFDGLEAGATYGLPRLRGGCDGSDSEVRVRRLLVPSLVFAGLEVMYLRRYGCSLDRLLSPSVTGYRLHPLARSPVGDGGQVLPLYVSWKRAYKLFQLRPVFFAHRLLANGGRCVAMRADVRDFYGSISPGFLLAPSFVELLGCAAHMRGTTFSETGYVAATASLVRAMSDLAHTTGATRTPETGLVVGCLTSRLIANLALREVDRQLESGPGVSSYSRYVDDMAIIADEGRREDDLQSRLHALLLAAVHRAGFELSGEKLWWSTLQPGFDRTEAELMLRHMSSEYRLLELRREATRVMKVGFGSDERWAENMAALPESGPLGLSAAFAKLRNAATGRDLLSLEYALSQIEAAWRFLLDSSRGLGAQEVELVGSYLAERVKQEMVLASSEADFAWLGAKAVSVGGQQIDTQDLSDSHGMLRGLVVDYIGRPPRPGTHQPSAC